MLIIPDVHGRTFWKSVIDNNEEEIVFLGDYLDPYPDEGYSKEWAIENFKDIISFAKANSKVTLLLGNHCCGYCFNHFPTCRNDVKHYTEIRNLFYQNKQLFKIGLLKTINEQNYLFSHSGFIFDWIDKFRLGTLPNAIDNINDILNTQDENLIIALEQVSPERGGWSLHSSCVWGDVSEFLDYKNSEYYQIFGHTRISKPIITDYWACLDCSKVFKLDEQTNELKEYE